MSAAARDRVTPIEIVDNNPSRILAFSEALAALSGWPRSILAFILGALSALAVAPFFAAPILFVTFPVLAWMLDANPSNQSKWQTWRLIAKTGWWFGFGFFLVGLHWIVEPFLVEAEVFAWLAPFAITLLPGGLALFFALAAVLARLMWTSGWRAAFPLAAAIGFTEWLRGVVLTGFPWNVIGHALTDHEIPLQSVSALGVNGLTVFAIVLFALPGLLLADVLSGRARWTTGVLVTVPLLVLVALMAFWGTHRLSTPVIDGDAVRLRLVQPAIPQEDKWNPEHREEIFSKLITLSRQNGSDRIDDLADRTHVIWPESAIPFLLLRTPKALAQIAALLPRDTQLLTGALRIVAAGNSETGERQIFNSLLAFNSDAQLLAQYDKQHLVPFGEYLPFQNLLETMGLQQLTRQRGGFASGTGPRRMDLPGTPALSPLVCYEGIFSGAVVSTPERPGWLLVVTNDAWFGAGAGPRQHYHHARVRAVEEGLPLVRVSNNGISAVIDPLGRVRASLGLNVSGTLDARLPGAVPETIFYKWRELPFWLLLALCVLASCVSIRVTRKSQVPTQP